VVVFRNAEELMNSIVTYELFRHFAALAHGAHVFSLSVGSERKPVGPETSDFVLNIHKLWKKENGCNASVSWRDIEQEKILLKV
jgi:hypothetical protein